MIKVDDELVSLWQSSSSKNSKIAVNTDGVIKMSRQKRRKNLFFYQLTITILGITLIGLCAFFYYIAPFREFISRTGVALMLVSLIVRIYFEIITLMKFIKLDLTKSASVTTDKHLRFYRFRKFVHGSVTYTVLIIYTIGFYLLTPEFSLYIELSKLIYIDVKYAIVAIVLFYFIRKQVQREMAYLTEIFQLEKEISENSKERV